MKTKTLKELIELARAGKKFEAKCLNKYIDNINQGDLLLQHHSWSHDAIVALWEYKEIREPQVFEFEFDCKDTKAVQALAYGTALEIRSSLYQKKWRIVATEILEET